MADHVGYINAPVICGTCGRFMDLSQKNRPDYEPGRAIEWVVTCVNLLCPHLGKAYKVTPTVQLTEV